MTIFSAVFFFCVFEGGWDGGGKGGGGGIVAVVRRESVSASNELARGVELPQVLSK